MNEITLRSGDLDLSVLYAPAEKPVGLVQIIHGMIEHKERYIDFTEYLNSRGLSVVISDNRGHGKSVNREYPLGHVGSVSQLVQDQLEVTKYIKAQNPGLPLYMFAHSMGSLIAREYIKNHDEEIAKLILCGTVAYNPAAGIGASIAKAKKSNGYSKLLWALSNGLSFKEDLSWLSYNRENIEKYAADELCSFKFTNLSNNTLFSMVRDLKKTEDYQFKNVRLKILSLSGKDDRTTGGTKALEKTLEFLRKPGYAVRYKEYENMKHEILNETKKDQVYSDAAQFYLG